MVQNCDFCINGEDALNTAIEMVQIAVTEYKLTAKEVPEERVQI